MKRAKLPKNELDRLKALIDYQILDTSPELEFDDITLMASTICNVPIALITLIDEHRQWFKSKVGIEGQETSREVSFCSHTILQNEVFLVPDATQDERFFDNPFVINDPKLRFYAGAPLIVPNGTSIGALCVVDQKPRELTDSQKSALAALSRQVVSQLELKKANRELTATFKQLQESASIIQEQQEKLIYASKMTALGEMAGGVAHEINNPLAIIQMRAEQIQDSSERGEIDLPFIQTSAKSILGLTDRISKIVKGLRSFSSSGAQLVQERVKIRSIIEDVISISSERFKSYGVELIFRQNKNAVSDSIDHSLEIKCYPIEITHVLINLLNNSFDAIQGLKEKWACIELHDLGDSIEILVSDSGNGIPPEIQRKMMQPFFTTKPIGEGVGLGLSVSLGFIQHHGGRLEYDSSQRHTQFRLILPKNLTS